MKFSYQPTGTYLTIISESAQEIVMLGKLNAKAPASHIRTEGPTATLAIEAEDLIKLAANGKL